MRLRAAAVLMGLAVCLTTASPGQEPGEASCSLRWVHGVPDLQAPETLILSLRPGGAESAAQAEAHDLSYGEASAVFSLAPGVWDASFQVGGRALRTLSFGCPSGGHYSLLAYGLDPRSADRGPAWMDRLREIFGGVETRSDQGFLLQVRILRDALGLQEDTAHVRLLHAAPGVSPISADLVRPSPGGEPERTGLAKGLPYAAMGEVQQIQVGASGEAATLELRLAGGRKVTLRRALEGPEALQPGTVTTFLLLGSPAAEGRSLELVVLRNPIRGTLVEPLWEP